LKTISSKLQCEYFFLTCVDLMPAALKRYKIEGAHGASFPETAIASSNDPRLEEILSVVQDLKRSFDPIKVQAADGIEIYKREINDVYRLRGELDSMKEAIESTKREIASLYKTEHDGKGMRRVAGELDAVVEATEEATSRILGAAEDIETSANMLRSAGVETGNNDCIGTILEKTVTLYEACNFQDLTGQRITKIVNVLKFVEDRLDNMIEVWGGLNALKDFIDPSLMASEDDESSLLNGPKLGGDKGHVGQNDIDDLFV
jgi:chemotaxis protein CheZ